MKIKLLCVGKDKDRYTKTAIDEYLKRLGLYSETEIVYLPDVPLGASNTTDIVKGSEGARILKYLTDKKKRHNKPLYIVCLDAGGKMYDSRGFARFLEAKAVQHEIVFIIGGVYGLSDEVKKAAHSLLSLSKLTFTHQMCRIILLEQIYRAFTILEGKKYHY